MPAQTATSPDPTLTTTARDALLSKVALASLVANVGIVITGGAVRLTGSGLGCPTWPSCTADSLVTTPELGIHGLIENANRLLTGVLVALAVAALLLARRHGTPAMVRLAVAVLAGIPAQAVLGGVTVLTDLNPWVVGLHFLLSMAIIWAAYELWRATRAPAAPAHSVPSVPVPLRRLCDVVLAAAALTITLGTVVTGSGPHAGDPKAPRNGLDPAALAQLHTDAVFLLIGLSVAAWFALRAAGATEAALRAGWLVAVEAAQGVIGFVQYYTNLPALVVGLHVAGACAVWLAALALHRSATPPPRLVFSRRS